MTRKATPELEEERYDQLRLGISCDEEQVDKDKGDWCRVVQSVYNAFNQDPRSITDMKGLVNHKLAMVTLLLLMMTKWWLRKWKHWCVLFTESGRRISVVLVLVEGGFEAVDDVKRYLDNEIPVVICGGTGRTADIIAYAFTHMSTQEEYIHLFLLINQYGP